MARFHGRARVDASHPEAFAVCDRCKFLYNRVDLKYQYEWAGPQMINRRLLVCQPCTDIPQEQKRTILISADPDPVIDPRVDVYNVDGGVAFAGDPGVQVPPPPPPYVAPPIVPGSLKFNAAKNSGLLIVGGF